MPYDHHKLQYTCNNIKIENENRGNPIVPPYRISATEEGDCKNDKILNIKMPDYLRFGSSFAGTLHHFEAEVDQESAHVALEYQA